MNLRIRYDDRYQILRLDTEAAGQLWVSLGLTDEGYTDAEKEQLIQERFEEVHNRPEYNSWHKYWRHHGDSKAEPDKDGADTSEPLMKEVVDDRIFRRDEIERDRHESYDAICQWVRKILVKKPKWADAFITVRMDGVSVNDHATFIGVSDASIVSKWLARAEKKLRENYPNCQI